VRSVPRPAKFTEDQILDAALRLVAEGGPGAATISGIAGLLGAPVGSIYHRFRSRDLLLARLWMRTIKNFQGGFLEALGAADVDEAALGAALYNVRWAREHLDEARVLLLYRREEMAGGAGREAGDHQRRRRGGGEGSRAQALRGRRRCSGVTSGSLCPR